MIGHQFAIAAFRGLPGASIRLGSNAASGAPAAPSVEAHVGARNDFRPGLPVGLEPRLDLRTDGPDGRHVDEAKSLDHVGMFQDGLHLALQQLRDMAGNSRRRHDDHVRLGRETWITLLRNCRQLRGKWRSADPRHSDPSVSRPLSV